MECSVCLSSIKIPLILECFECFRPYEYNCMTKNRVCFFCFLTMREKKTNCLICRSKAKDYDKFRVDLEYIYNDIKENDFQCKFCEKQFQTHKELYKHCFLEDKCIYKCECDKFIKKEEELFHKSECEKFILCNFCKCFHSKKNVLKIHRMNIFVKKIQNDACNAERKREIEIIGQKNVHTAKSNVLLVKKYILQII